MRPVHYLTLLSALLLTAALYYLPSTVPPKKAPATTGDAPHEGGAEGGMQMQRRPVASTAAVLAAARSGLPSHAGAEVEAVESLIRAAKDSASMAPLYDTLAAVWGEHRQVRAAAYYKGVAAHLARSEKNLNFAGQFFLDLMHRDTSAPMQLWEAQQAIGCFSEALALNPNNDSTKILLASGYIEGSDNPMQGIGMLREIVAKEPDHVPANLMLGQFSMQSRQFDKAVKRFETVLQREPDNWDALMGLAESYKETGQREKARATFERCKQLTKSAEIRQDIDAYLKTF